MVKMARRSFLKKVRQSREEQEILHSVLCVPMTVASLRGAQFFMVLVHDCTRITYIRFLRRKSEALDVFKNLVAEIRIQKNGQVRTLRRDNGTEYCNADFSHYLNSEGIQHETTTPYTPEHNGPAERTNRALI